MLLSEVHKALFLLFYFLFLLYLKNGGGGGDVAPAARVATGRGCVSGGYLGRRIPCGTTNPSWATLILWSRGSLALIMHLGAWNGREIEVYPRMRFAALS